MIVTLARSLGVVMVCASRTVIGLLVAALSLTGCVTNETGGQVGGGLLGAVAGQQTVRAIGGGENAQLLGALVGAAAGAYAGGMIGRRLDERDRLLAEQARTRALDGTGTQRVDWTSAANQGISGRAEARPSTASANCRVVTEVAYIRGEEVTEERTFCRNAEGAWNVA